MADEKVTQEYNKLLKKNSNLLKENTQHSKKRTKAAKEYHTAMGSIIGESKDFNKVLNSAAVTSDSLNSTLKNLPKIAQKIGAMSSEFEKINSAASDVGETLSDLGISYHKKSKIIEKRTAVLSTEFAALIRKSTGIAKLGSSFDNVQKVLRDVQKEMTNVSKVDASGSILEMRKNLSDLEGNLPVGEFKKLDATLSKMSTQPLEKLPELMNEFKDTIKSVDISDMGNVADVDAFRAKLDNLTSSLDTLGMSSDSQDKITDLQKLMTSLVGSDVMGLFGEEVTNMVATTCEELKKPEANIESLISNFDRLSEEVPAATSKLGDEISGSSKRIRDDLKLIGLDLGEISKDFAVPKALEMNTAQAMSKISDFKDEVSRQEFVLGTEGLMPDSVIDNAKELGSLEDAILKKQSVYAKSLEKMAALDEGAIGDKKSLQKVQQKILSDIKEMVSHSDKLVDSSHERLVLAEEIAEKGFGRGAEKAKQMGDKLMTAEIILQKMGKKGGMFGKILNGLGSKAGKLAGKMKGLALPIGVLMGAISLGKKFVDLEAKGSQMFQGVSDAGLVVGADFESVGDKMTTAMNQAHNLEGLASAVGKVRGAMALNREEILGVAKGLNDAGLAGRNLQSQMAATGESISGTGDGLVDAATQVRTFSGSLGIADSEITGMMGNMAHEFNSTMGSMGETFTDITNAVHGTAMSTNRFLGIVQTSTAGMSLYEDQVSSVAKMVGELGKNAALSGKDIETLAKTVGGFGKDTDQAIKGFAVLGKKGMTEMGQKMDPTIAAQKDKIKAASGRGENTQAMEAQLGHMVDMKEALLAGNAVAAGQKLKYVDPESSKQLVGGLLEATREMGGLMGEKVAKMLGVYEAHIQNVRTGGALTDHTNDGKFEKIKGGSGPKTKEELRDIEAKKQEQTGGAMSKSLAAISDKAATLATDFKGLGVAVAVAAGALSSLATGGGIVGDTVSSTVGSVVGDVVSKKMGGLGILKKAVPVLAKLGPAVAKLAGPAAAVIGAGVAGFAVGTAAMNTETGQKVSDWGSDKARQATNAMGGTSEKEILKAGEEKAFADRNKFRKSRGKKEWSSMAEEQAYIKKRKEGRASRIAARAKVATGIPSNLTNAAVIPANTVPIGSSKDKEASASGNAPQPDGKSGEITINVYDATDPNKVAKVVRNELQRINRGN